MKKLLFLLLSILSLPSCFANTTEPYFDFDIPESPLSGFTRFEKSYAFKEKIFSDPIQYNVTIDYPNETFPHRAEVMNFILQSVGCGDVAGSIFALDDIFKNEAKQWRDEIMEENSEEDILDFDIAFENDIEYCAYSVNKNFVTFSEFQFSYFGGAHGFFFRDFLTFDLLHNEPVSNETLFRDGTLDAVTRVLAKYILADEDYKECHEEITSVAEVVELIEDLPTAAILHEGALFSFPPYHLGPYSEGCYHFLIPWKSLQQFLSPAGKEMLGL